MKQFLLLFFVGLSHCFGQSPDGGDLLYSFEKSNKYPVSLIMPYNQGINDFREFFNQTLALPQDIPVIFCDCGVENAFYNPAKKSVTICYEYVQSGLDRMKKYTVYSQDEKIAAITLFVLGHELGHALIDQYDLPIVGKEEDAADQFSAIFLLKNDKFYSYALKGTTHWLLDAIDPAYQDKLRKNSSGYFSDIHGLTLARYYNYLALVCGYNPEVAFQSGLINDTQHFRLPLARGKQASYEYQQAKRSWDRLLASHYKTDDTQYSIPDSVAVNPKSNRTSPAPGGTRIERLSKQVQVEIIPSDWHVLYFPSNVYPLTSGRVTYQVKLDSSKQITSVRGGQSSLSDADELVVRRALSRFMFDKDKPVSLSTDLTITLIFNK